MSADIVAEFIRRKQATRWCPHEPTSKQAQFLALDCREALYGGAAGGGKSDALLMAALQYVHVPGYAAIIFRRTYADLALPGALMDRAREWLQPTAATWNEREKTWTFPSGATLTFGYLEHEADKFRYQSAEFQFIGFDEATQFTETQYKYLLSRLRRCVGHNVPLRQRAASNPGGLGHEWVKARFVKPGREGCVFVAARLVDNPHLDQESYRANLRELDEATRRQLEDGDWDVEVEGLIYQYSPRLNALDAMPDDIPGLPWVHILALDFGVTSTNAISVLAFRAHDPVTYVAASYYFRGEPTAMSLEVKALMAQVRPERVIGDIGGLGKGYAEEMIVRHDIPVEGADKENKIGFIKLLNGALERGELKVVPETCGDLIGEWKSLPWDATKMKEAKGFPNHCADATLYGWRWCRSYAAKLSVDVIIPGTQEWERAEQEKRRREYEKQRDARFSRAPWRR